MRSGIKVAGFRTFKVIGRPSTSITNERAEQRKNRAGDNARARKQRTLFLLSGGLILAVGGYYLVYGIALLVSKNPWGAFPLIFAFNLILLGWFIVRSTSASACPNCEETIGYKAKRCRYCGAKISVPDESTVSNL